MSERIPVTVELDSDDLRAWADRHADAGHHGVAHALYQAANGVESITEQHDRETAARTWERAVDCLRSQWEDVIPAAIADLERRNPYREGDPT